MPFSRTLLIFILGSFIILLSCNNDTIVVPKSCDEEPNFSFTHVKLKLTTADASVFDTINIDTHGHIYGDNVRVLEGGRTLIARIGGHICKENIFSVNVIFNNTSDNSRMRIEGQLLPNNYITGTINYCDNLNNNCNFVQIGYIEGIYTGTYQGGFHTPLFNGLFTIDDMYN